MKKNDSSKKKFSPAQIIPLALGLIVGLVAGTSGAATIDAMSGGNDALFFAYLGVLMAGLILAFPVQIVLHEGGHLVAGLMSGYSFVSFNILGFIWQKDAEGRLRIGRMQIAGAGGQCLMAPPEYNGGDFPFTLYNLGGALVNLIFAALFGLMARLIPSAPLRLLLIPEALVGVMFAILNGLPLPVLHLQNDGTNLLCIRRDAHARRAFWVQMSIAAAAARGVRMKDMPEDWFAPFPDEAMDNPIVCAVAVMNTSRLIDRMDFGAAEAAIRTLLSRQKGVLGLYRASMACDGAVCELIDSRPGDITAILEEQEIQQILTAMKAHPAVLRTQYALALLKDHDADKAQSLLERFDAAARKHPNPQEITGERELLQVIRNAAQKGDAAE